MSAKPNNLEAYWMPFTANRAYKAATLANQPMEHTQTAFEGEGFDLEAIAQKYDANG